MIATVATLHKSNIYEGDSHLRRLAERAVIVTDSEWHQYLQKYLDEHYPGLTTATDWLMTQFKVRGGKVYLFCNPVLMAIPYFEVMARMAGAEVLWRETPELTCFLKDVLLLAEIPQKMPVDLVMFWSAKDLEYAIGWPRWERFLLQDAITQKRNIRVSYDVKGQSLDLAETGHSIKIRDFAGWGSSGLKSQLEACGVNMKDKDALDDYKAKMFEGHMKLTERAIAYDIGDVNDLLQGYEAFPTMVENLMLEAVGLDIRGRELPATIGALAAMVLQEWMRLEAPDKFDFCACKHGILDTSDRGYKTALKARRHILKHVKTWGDWEALKGQKAYGGKDTWGKLWDDARYEFLGYSQATVGYLALQDSSAAFSALVQGGRCANERPWEYKLGIGADIDLNSCYGSALRDFTLPVGLPTVIQYHRNEDTPTLGEVLNKLEGELLPGLWSLTISGTLPFSQDLLFSKIASQYQINKAAWGGFDKDSDDITRDNSLAHIPGDFALIRQEIENGVLTDDILKALRAVATAQELKAIYELKVTSGVYYAASDKTDREGYFDAVIADTEDLRYKGHDRLDRRSRKWFGLPLEGFIGKLVDVRKAAKAAKDKAKSDTLKLFINTTYGVLASPYFPVGNTCVANNITAKARLGAWMLGKSLGCRQLITDGGFYSVESVPYLDTTLARFERPGLAKLSDFRAWAKRGCKYKPLGDRAWAEEYKQLTERSKTDKRAPDAFAGAVLDVVAMAHINEFWGHYGLELPFSIEHKGDNTFNTAAFLGKAHYAMDTVSGKRLFKVRGTRDDAEVLHPTRRLLGAVLDGSDDFPETLWYTHTTALKAGKWLTAQQSNEGYMTIKENDYRPGDFIQENRSAQYNDGHRFIYTVKDYKSSANVRRTEPGGKTKRLLYERYGSQGISSVVKAMAEHKPFMDGPMTVTERSESSKAVEAEWLGKFSRGITQGDIPLV